MQDGYVTGSSGMSYCNQTPFPLREGWGLGTRLESMLRCDEFIMLIEEVYDLPMHQTLYDLHNAGKTGL